MSDNGSISYSIGGSHGFTHTPEYPGMIPSDAGQRNRGGSGMLALIQRNNAKAMRITRFTSTAYEMVL